MQNTKLSQDPEVQKLVRRAEIEGRRRTAFIIVEGRFPALAELAQQVILGLESIDDLSLLAKQIAFAPDEDMAHWLLDTYKVQIK